MSAGDGSLYDADSWTIYAGESCGGTQGFTTTGGTYTLSSAPSDGQNYSFGEGETCATKELSISCTAIGNSCSSNSECCTGSSGNKICEPDSFGENYNEVCRDSCPSDFTWSVDKKECVPAESTCYSEPDPNSCDPSATHLACSGLASDSACCTWKNYNGTEYGKSETISKY